MMAKRTKGGGLVESRSSVLIPVPSSSFSKQPDEKILLQTLEGRAGLDSGDSLPYNTDINIEKIEVVYHSKEIKIESPKAMRKAATN